VYSSVASKIDSALTGTYTSTSNIDYDVKAPDYEIVTSPWGPGLELFTYSPGTIKSNILTQILNIGKDLLGISNTTPKPGVTVWCLTCESNANLNFIGSITFSLTHGLTDGFVEMQGSMGFGIDLGIQALAPFNENYTEDFVTEGIPGFSIPDIIEIGPYVAMGYTIDLNISALGQIRAGVDLQWPNVGLKLDFVDGSQSSATGWTPQTTWDFDARGQSSYSPINFVPAAPFRCTVH